MGQSEFLNEVCVESHESFLFKSDRFLQLSLNLFYTHVLLVKYQGVCKLLTLIAVIGAFQPVM